MNRLRFIVVGVVSLGLIAIAGFFIFGFLQPKAAGLLIETNPAATVYINGQQAGKTPYKNTHEPGEVVVKLIPDSFEVPLSPYETKTTLVSGVETIVRRDFAETDDLASGEIVSFEPSGSKDAGIAIISVPDNTTVLIDDSIKAVTPFKTSDITPGRHEVSISSQGYKKRVFTMQAYNNYNLTAVVYLGKETSPTEPESIETLVPEVEDVDKVEILSTPVGYLRVRQEPSTASEEIGRVNPGDLFEIIEEDVDTGWFKIEYKDGEEGWVSKQYARKKTSISPTATPTEASET